MDSGEWSFTLSKIGRETALYGGLTFLGTLWFFHTYFVAQKTKYEICEEVIPYITSR